MPREIKVYMKQNAGKAECFTFERGELSHKDGWIYSNFVGRRGQSFGALVFTRLCASDTDATRDRGICLTWARSNGSGWVTASLSLFYLSADRSPARSGGSSSMTIRYDEVKQHPMFYTKMVKPWLKAVLPCRAGRLYETDFWPGERHYVNPEFCDPGGFAECFACPEIGQKFFRKNHTLARFLRQHRRCGSPRVAYAASRR